MMIVLGGLLIVILFGLIYLEVLFIGIYDDKVELDEPIETETSAVGRDQD